MEEGFKLSNYLDKLIGMTIEFAPKLLLALVVLIIGLWIIRNIVKMIGKTMDKSNLDKDIQPFLKSLVGVLLKVMLLFSVAGIVGIETTSFVAVLAAAGFAIGMALQGSLGNFAAGVMILLFKPYRIGDLIKTQDQTGHVQEIQIFNTIISTPDNKTVIIPNGQAISGPITNLSTREYLRLDLNIAIPYEEDFPKVERIILEALLSTPKVLSDPAPFVGIEQFDSHNIKLAVRPHAKTEDYWEVYFNSYRNVKEALSRNGIKMAYSEGIELGNIGG